MRQIAHATAAELRIHGDAEQAELAELGPEVAGELVAAINLLGPRRDLGVSKAAHRIAQQIQVFAE